MMTNVTQAQNATVSCAGQSEAAKGLALVRITIGTMFVWVFFENLEKGAYTPAGYAGVINYYIKNSHAPAVWKMVLGFMSSHAAMVAPGQAAMELSVGILLAVGLLTRPVALVAFLFLGSLWVTELGISWIWELLVPVLASLGLAVGRAGRAWGIDALLARRSPASQWW
ncbi:MAG TPA: DoxX family membrane protein [Candidatus Acidoferrum sp.]